MNTNKSIITTNSKFHYKVINEEEDILKREQIKDKLDFNQSIIEERNDDIQKIYKDILDINEIFKDLDKIVNEQSEPIEQIEKQFDLTIKKTNDGIYQLQKANEYHKSWLSKRNKIILMSIAGLSINVPITVLFGLKAGVISGLSTVGFSAITTLFNNK